MPTVLRTGPYRVFFYSSDRDEPAHVHVQRDDCMGKYWLQPIRLQSSRGFNRSELGRIQAIVEANAPALLESWNEFFDL